jgi:hypothetical protein
VRAHVLHAAVVLFGRIFALNIIGDAGETAVSSILPHLGYGNEQGTSEMSRAKTKTYG